MKLSEGSTVINVTCKVSNKRFPSKLSMPTDACSAPIHETLTHLQANHPTRSWSSRHPPRYTLLGQLEAKNRTISSTLATQYPEALGEFTFDDIDDEELYRTWRYELCHLDILFLYLPLRILFASFHPRSHMDDQKRDCESTDERFHDCSRRLNAVRLSYAILRGQGTF